MLVDTESPIFDNIEQIARTILINVIDDDQKKFQKKLSQMGMSHLKQKMDTNINQVNNEINPQNYQKFP